MSPALARAFSPWVNERILELGSDLLVVDKPSGLVVHGGGVPEHDVVSRLEQALRARGASTYLAVHQRLDVGTSGVLCFVRDTALNALVGSDFESGSARKRYLAAVELRGGSPLAKLDRVLLEHRLETDANGVRVVKTGGKSSRAECRVLERRGARTLLELRPITGRTHQLRVQLAAVGAPIAGDKDYDGSPAPRLLLHAAELELPGIGRRFEARVPPILERYLSGTERALGERAELRARLLDAACFRAPIAANTGIFRWVNGEGDELPGVVIDLYGHHATLSLDSEEANAKAHELSELLLELGVEGVYLKRRVRADLRRVEHESLAPSAPVAGRPLEDPVVDENGMRIGVELGQGLSTGLFIDQRENRKRVRELSRGGEVLNLFSYTCSFSVAAALGGARRVTSVDTAGRALARGVENFRLNGLDPEQHAFIKEDAIDYLERAARRGKRFDLIVLDPPSFATRDKTKVLSVGRDYAELVRRALLVLAPSGSLLAVTNHRKTKASALRRTLIESAEKLGHEVRRAKILPSALDCRDSSLGPEPSKSVLLTIA